MLPRSYFNSLKQFNLYTVSVWMYLVLTAKEKFYHLLQMYLDHLSCHCQRTSLLWIIQIHLAVTWRKSNRASDMSMTMVQKHWSECCISEQRKHFLTLSNKGCEMLCSWPLRESCRRSHIFEDKPGFNSSQRERKIFRDVKGIGREEWRIGGLVREDNSLGMKSGQRGLGLWHWSKENKHIEHK